MSTKKISFKQFLEELEFDMGEDETNDNHEEDIDDTSNLDTKDAELRRRMKSRKGKTINQGISSDESEIDDAFKSSQRASKAGFY